MGSVTTAWARHAEQLVVEPRCRSASLSIGYAMAIHKPMAVGGTRVVGSGMRVGRPAGGSSWPPRTHHPGAARPARRVVVGNLGYDVSFTLPKSYSLLPAFADSDTAAAAAVESVYTEAVGRTFGWLERQCAYGMRGQPTASSPAGVIATGPNLTVSRATAPRNRSPRSSRRLPPTDVPVVRMTSATAARLRTELGTREW